MIRDKKAQTFFIDFEEVRVPGGRPSDIDMYYVVPDYVDDTLGGFVILGEIKNEEGTFKDSQRRLYTNLVENCKKGGCVLYIVHDKKWQNGDYSVNVAECKVEEYYYNKKWRKPERYTTVNEAITKILACERTRYF